jgi:trypsin
MRKIKPMLTVVMLAVMLAAVAGSAAFAAPQQPDQQQPGQQPGQQQEPPGPGIVGGSNVPDSNKYPWIAAILDVNRKVPGGTDQNMFFCGGSLIDSDSVLTAAHCLNNVGNRYLRVVLGRAQLSSSGGEVRYVSTWYKHPDYREGSYNNDVAVLTLDKPVTGITPVRVPLSTSNWNEEPGRWLSVAGWGTTVSGGRGASDQLQQARVQVVSDADAAKIYPDYVQRNMIAAGGNGQATVCSGDSGGPLFGLPPLFKVSTPENPNPPRVYHQIGIASFQRTVGGEVVCDGPGAFTEVNAPSIRDFITTSMNQ